MISYVNQFYYVQTLKTQEAIAGGILREAYEAGYDRGQDDAFYECRGGPYTTDLPDFDQWLASKMKEAGL